nr:BBE domain-containing protein [Streptomyces hawaiiensis]
MPDPALPTSLTSNTDGAYVNYPDIDLGDQEFNTSRQPWHQLYYKNNYTRLQKTKQQWDPHNVFRHGQSIQPPKKKIEAVQPLGGQAAARCTAGPGWEGTCCSPSRFRGDCQTSGEDQRGALRQERRLPGGGGFGRPRIATPRHHAGRVPARRRRSHAAAGVLSAAERRFQYATVNTPSSGPHRVSGA